MSNENIIERVAKVEEVVKIHSEQLRRLESSNEAITEIRTIVKLQAEMNKSQNETLSKINDNLTTLNMSQVQMKAEVGQIGEKVEHLEKAQQKQKDDHENEKDKSRLSMPELGVKLVTAIILIFPTLISLWLAIKMGLK